MGRHTHPDSRTGAMSAVDAGAATDPVGFPAPPPRRLGLAHVEVVAEEPPGPLPMPTAPRRHNGRDGNVLRRSEPKVRAASVAALLTPLALFYGHQFLPGIEAMPVEAVLAVDSALTGMAVFVAGFVAKAVDRLDLFAATTGDG